MCIHCENIEYEDYFCDNEYVYFERKNDDDFNYSRIVKSDNYFWIESKDEYEYEASSVQINYCPWCSRKLVD